MSDKPDFATAFAAFLLGAQRLCDEHVKRSSFPWAETLTTEPGKRFIRIVKTSGSSRSAWAFIDTTTGDVLKPADWRKPAKHARGNIYDEHNGLKNCTAYGPNYLR